MLGIEGVPIGFIKMPHLLNVTKEFSKATAETKEIIPIVNPLKLSKIPPLVWRRKHVHSFHNQIKCHWLNKPVNLFSNNLIYQYIM